MKKRKLKKVKLSLNNNDIWLGDLKMVQNVNIS